MAACSVCGEVEDHLIHTCNHCGRKHCSEHQLPENHLCIPPKSRISDEADGRKRNWSSEKHKRKNVMSDKRRSRRDDGGSSGIGPSKGDGFIDLKNHGSASSKDEGDESGGGNFPNDEEAQRQRAREEMNRRLSGNTESKRPLEDDEIDADQESSASEWIDDVKRNREALNKRLSERHRRWEKDNPSRTGSEQGGTSADTTDSDEWHIPRPLLIVLLFIGLTMGYLLLGSI